jgi:hypothetical protein
MTPQKFISTAANTDDSEVDEISEKNSKTLQELSMKLKRMHINSSMNSKNLK